MNEKCSLELESLILFIEDYKRFYFKHNVYNGLLIIFFALIAVS
jgi:hypothetical protein